MTLLALSIFLILLTAGCSTVVQGYNNLVHGPQTASNSAANQGKPKTLPGNAGTVTTLVKVEADVEQELAYDLRSQTQTLRFSILSRDKRRIEMRSESILIFCDKAEKRLVKVESLRATYVRNAIKILRIAVPRKDVEGLNKAIKQLVQVRSVGAE